MKAKCVNLVPYKSGKCRKRISLLILAPCIFIYVYYTLTDETKTEDRSEEEDDSKVTNENQKYLINTSACRIPDIDPFNEEINKYVVKENYIPCTDLGLLTYIDKGDGFTTLNVNTSLLSLYSSWDVQCCYSKIYRVNYFNKSDNEIRYSPCVKFQDKVNLSFPFVKVECSNFFRTIYSNVHATVLRTKNKDHNHDRKNRYSVLLVGIDSISKLNLRRTMPKTYSYLEENFHNLKGYNKIGDNTFPNLMAVLTGQNTEQLRKTCSLKMKLNNCDMIWSTFRDLGYTTAYAEDECSIGTFNYDRPGFLDPPTDYYYRPYLVASEELQKTLRHGMTYCAGPETSGERILNIAKDFSVSFKGVPNFGLFWMNSFSHDNINIPSAMDEKVLEFLSDTSFKSSLENTIMVFFSDHGFRFGDIRYTHTGWLEERLPFIYFHIPESFKKNFLGKYQNFVENTQRLTTPYDLYCTLQDVLAIGSPKYKAKNSTGCPNCRSLFEKIAENRTCNSASIDLHWCTCSGHTHINPNTVLVRDVAQYVVDSINNIVNSFDEGYACSVYKLKKIVTAGMSDYSFVANNESVRYFLVLIDTNPSAMFEATVEVSEQGNFKLLGDISRTNRYKDYTFCVKSGGLKKYCFCDGHDSVLRSAICRIFGC